MPCMTDEITRNMLDKQDTTGVFKSNASQSEVVEIFDYVNNVISREEDVDGNKNYVFKVHPSHKVGPSVTKATSSYNSTLIDESHKQSAELGTDIHDILEDLLHFYKDGNADHLLAAEKKQADSNFVISETNMSELKKLAKEVIAVAVNRQKKINEVKGTTGDFVLRTEQRLFNFVKNRGGTADILFVYSDGTVGLHDFKTFGERGNTGEKLSTLDFFNKRKMGDYSNQLSEYKEILLQYGVSDVTGGTLFPVHVEFDENKIVQILEVGYGDKASPYLGEVLVTKQRTALFKGLDKFISDTYDRIKYLETRKPKNYKKEIKIMKTLIEDMSKVNSLSGVLEQIKSLQFYIAKQLKIVNTLSTSEYDLKFISEMNNLLNAISMFKDIDSKLKEYTEFIKKVDMLGDEKTIIKGIRNKVNSNLTSYSQLISSALANHIHNVGKSSGTMYNFDFMGGTFQLEDENAVALQTSTRWDLNNPILKEAQRIKGDIHTTLLKNIRNVGRITFQLEDAAMIEGGYNSRQEMFNQLIEQEENSFGRGDEKLFNRISQTFFNLKKKAFDTSELAAAQFVKANYQTGERFRMAKEEAEVSFNLFIDKTFGEGLARREKKAQNIVKKLTENFHDKWDLKTNKAHKELAWLMEIKDSVFEQYINPKYAAIRGTALGDFYDHYQDTMDDMLSNVQKDAYYKKRGNFIPYIRKHVMERYMDNTLENSAKGFLSDVAGAFTLREEDFDYSRDDSGDLRVPIYWMTPFMKKVKTDEGEISTAIKSGEKSLDLSRSLIMFSKMSMSYDAFSKSESVVLALRHVLENSQYEPSNMFGKPSRNELGDINTSKVGKDHAMYKYLDSMIKLYWYGLSSQKGFHSKVASLGKYENEEGDRFERVLSVDKTLDTIRNLEMFRTLGGNPLSAFASFSAGLIQSRINSYKGMSYTKQNMNDSIRDRVSNRHKYLAFSYAVDLNTEDIVTRALSQEELAKKKGQTGIGDIFSDPTRREGVLRHVNARLAMGIWSAGDEVINNLLLSSISRNYYYNKERNLVRRIKPELHRNEDGSLKEGIIPIWDMFSYNNDTGEMKLEGVSDETADKIFTQMRNITMAVQNRVKGSADSLDKAQYQTNSLLRIMSQYKNWMPGIMRERFGKLRYDDRTDILEWGRWKVAGANLKTYTNTQKEEFLSPYLWIKSIGLPFVGKFMADAFYLHSHGNKGKFQEVLDGTSTDKFFKERLRLMYNEYIQANPRLKDFITFEDFIRIQQGQLLAGAIQARFVLALTIMVLLVGSAFSEDEESWEDTFASRRLLMLLSKIKRELAFFIDPTDVYNTVAKPFPVLGFFNDGAKALGNFLDESIGTDTDKTGFFHYSSKFLPFNKFLKFVGIIGDD